MNVITGVFPASAGKISHNGQDITHFRPYQAARAGLARTFQVVQPFPDMTVLDNVAAAALFSRHEGGPAHARSVAREQLEVVGISDLAAKPASSLTLAMRKRLELAKALAMKPQILFLDEVNAGLNSKEVEQAMALIQKVAGMGVTIVMIEHLMKVVLNVCKRLVVLHNGSLIADDTPDAVIRDPLVVEAYLGQRYAQQQQTVSPAVALEANHD